MAHEKSNAHEVGSAGSDLLGCAEQKPQGGGESAPSGAAQPEPPTKKRTTAEMIASLKTALDLLLPYVIDDWVLVANAADRGLVFANNIEITKEAAEFLVWNGLKHVVEYGPSRTLHKIETIEHAGAAASGGANPQAQEQEDYEYPPEVRNIVDRCEANVTTFSNDDVSTLLCEINRLVKTQSAAPSLKESAEPRCPHINIARTVFYRAIDEFDHAGWSCSDCGREFGPLSAQPSPSAMPTSEWTCEHGYKNPRRNCKFGCGMFNGPEVCGVTHPHTVDCVCGASASPSAPVQTRFADFDDAEHPANKWWQKHGQFMLSGGGRREFIWACRGWIAREQLAEGVEVTGVSAAESAPLAVPAQTASQEEHK